ncbi:hypothetical protein [Chitinophaga tropicalis]|uniref:TIR domain-containing protein n=1 Tax=Chitinophaga tropicalis TaxID=2683588 RepID=A0A7K1U6M5_9BACT|nr:hypothetical protein [Chitinophaga tropicalis]MVT09999.1 hypothetical protein [Chitinophaga tropicalis]
MKIFIGFGYNENDKWIKDLVIPLVQSFDATVITGEDLHGQIISQEVTNRIKDADGLLAFLTPREALASGKYTTHQWVKDELIIAINSGIPAVEIRANEVEAQGGIAGDRQRIEFSLDNKAKLLVDLAGLLSLWRRSLKSRRFFLLPRDIVQDARPYIRGEDLKCTYQFMHGSRESQVYKAKPFRFGQGLCVDIRHVPAEDCLVQVTLAGPQFEWSSNYESVQLLSINLQKS